MSELENVQRTIDRNEALLEKLRIENNLLTAEDSQLIDDALKRSILGNMGDAEVTVANQGEMNLKTARAVAEINKTRAETLQLMEKIDAERRETEARIEKIKAESALVHEEKKNSRWKIWAPVIGSAGTVALLWIGEKVFNVVLTGKAPNFIKKL